MISLPKCCPLKIGISKYNCISFLPSSLSSRLSVRFLFPPNVISLLVERLKLLFDTDKYLIDQDQGCWCASTSCSSLIFDVVSTNLLRRRTYLGVHKLSGSGWYVSLLFCCWFCLLFVLLLLFFVVVVLFCLLFLFFFFFFFCVVVFRKRNESVAYFIQLHTAQYRSAELRNGLHLHDQKEYNGQVVQDGIQLHPRQYQYRTAKCFTLGSVRPS